MKHFRIPAILLAIITASCNSTEGERFNKQQDYYTFSSTTSTLTAHGASLVDDIGTSAFRCPSISGMSSESNLAVFYAQANAPTPSFTLETVAGIRGDSGGGVGISLRDMPLGMLDIYERCNSTSYEKLMTACPLGYELVKECSDPELGAKECVQVYDGTHRIIVHSIVSDDPACLSEEVDRSPYSASISPMSLSCDAFTPILVPAAIRGSTPNNTCCDVDETNTFDFCLKPCGCRKTIVELVPKDELLTTAEASTKVDTLTDHVTLAVFSNVEGNTSAFKDLLNSISENRVDLVISLGNLTEDGAASQFNKFKKIVTDTFNLVDGKIYQLAPELGINATCTVGEEQICCEDGEVGTGRIFTNLCNALIFKIAFINGLGDSEFEGSLETYNQNFGPSNLTTTIGKVQIIMLDTAEASINGAQKKWLASELKSHNDHKCTIPAPTRSEQWPTLTECHDILGVPIDESVTCRECIAQEAYCIPPDKERDNITAGPENCVCVPYTSEVCPGNLTCAAADGTEHDCICTRDHDCGAGGTCVDGKCIDPIRLVFSYTPIFDESGTRNNAFSSRQSAASLLSMLLKYNVNAVFAGRVLDYASYSKGGMQMYITGGGGADMASFANKGRHWLRIDIPNGYTRPDPDKISVTVVPY